MSLAISIFEYVDEIKNGNLTAEEFISKTMDRIKQVDDNLHAYLSLNENAVEQARKIDKKIKSKEKVGKCLGMPISFKDNFCVKGTKTTCGSKILEDFVAPYDATVVTKLKSEDAIIIGKTNMDEFAIGLTSEFSAFGPSKNPWNTEYTPGGSSGGSGVAVSALECIAAFGSDTGGSVRNPASFCSIVGYKPTYGLVSRYGIAAYSNSIEVPGPMTRTVKDAAFLLNIIAGRDPNDNTTIDNKGEDYLYDLDAGIDGKKIGVVKEMIGEGTDNEVASATRNAVSQFEKLGAKVEEISLDMVNYSVAAYYTITAAEATSNLARLDNIRYGFDFDIDGYKFNSYISKARKKLGPEVIRRMILGGFVPSAGNADRYFYKALKVKNALIEQVNEAFKKVDLLIGPTVPILPFKFGSKIEDPVALFLVDSCTVTANLTNQPAITIPFEFANGLPIGIQIHAKPFQDRLVLQAGHALEKTTNLPKDPILK